MFLGDVIGMQLRVPVSPGMSILAMYVEDSAKGRVARLTDERIEYKNKLWAIAEKGGASNLTPYGVWVSVPNDFAFSKQLDPTSPYYLAPISSINSASAQPSLILSSLQLFTPEPAASIAPNVPSIEPVTPAFSGGSLPTPDSNLIAPKLLSSDTGISAGSLVIDPIYIGIGAAVLFLVLLLRR